MAETIPDFFRGKNIFITGGSGFIGKVLIEKLLRSCPDLENIYLLMREKKGKTSEERVKLITDMPVSVSIITVTSDLFYFGSFLTLLKPTSLKLYQNFV